MTDLDRDDWRDQRPTPAGEGNPGLEERVDGLEALVAQLSKKLKEKDEEEPPPLRFTTLPEFVAWFAQWYRRESSEFTWCPQWWLHPEAVIRLEAVWRVYEAMRHDAATGISVWLRDHVDPHMSKLTSEFGPLRNCKPEEHQYPLEPLKLVPPPDDWWTEADSGL